MAEVAIPYNLETPYGTINFNVDGEDGFKLTAVNGLDNPTIRSSMQNAPGRDGAILFDSYRGARQPVLEGYIRTTSLDLSQRLAYEDQLRGYTNSILRQDGILSWTGTDGVDRQLTVRLLEPLQMSISSQSPVFKDFQLALVSGDPWIYSALQYSNLTDPITEGEGLWVFPFTFPFAFGEVGTGGRTTIINNGNIPSKPIIDIYGPITSDDIQCQLINLTTSKTLYFTTDFELEPGPFVRLDFQNETILLNNTLDNNYISYLDVANSEFWDLQPGSNTIMLLCGGSSSTTQARIYYRHAWA